MDRDTLLGPFCKNPFKYNAHYAPLNNRPKKDSVERRIIVDMSRPKGNCENEGILKDRGRVFTYPKVDDLVKIIQKKGRGCKIFKKDLRSAYKQMICQRIKKAVRFDAVNYLDDFGGTECDEAYQN